MKKSLILLAVVLFLSSCNSSTKEKTDTTNEEKTNVVALKNFTSEAENYIDKEIEIYGIVDHVCKHGGKKLLLVDDQNDVHVTSDIRFDENLIGSQITLKGIVVEEKIDEAYCLQMEDNIMKNHSEGNTSEEQYAANMDLVEQYRKQIHDSEKGYISNYSLKYVSHTKTE